MADTTEQLGLNLKINEAIKERNVLMEKQRSLIIDQIAISRELCNAMECVDTDKVSENILRTKESLEALFEASDKASNNLDKVSGKLDKTKKAAGGLAAGAAGAVTFFKGFNKVLGAVTGQIGNLVKGAWTIVKAFGQIAKSIISIPFKMMEGLVDLSNRWGRITEYAKALEDVREKFGDLQKGTSQILKESMIPMREQFGKLTAAGHGFSATFGVGPEGMANALRFNAELMEKLNGGTQRLREEIGQNIAAMAIYRKGMGLTADQQATLIQLADAQGKSITAVQHEFAKFSLGMGKRFGLDSKLIAKSMADMTANVGDFGTLSTKQLAQVATYTQKLGIETKALQGVIKKYDDFESAAKSAAMLNQTFGMQIDVMRMLKDEDPASRLSQLQKSFQATGKSYEQLSRAERRRLAELAGLDDKSAALAFSQGGLSKSYEEVQAAGEETEVGFKDINETLKELSKNMKKIFHEPDDYKSFFQAFMRGFERGIMLSKPMLTLMRNLRRSLHVVERAGRQVGRAFVEMFPGVKQMLTGLSDFFNPGTTRQRMSKVVASFKEFFQTLQNGPSAARKAVGKLWDDLTGNFTSFFGSKSGTTSKIFEGLKTFGAVLGNVALNFGVKVLENVSKGLRVIGDFFKNLKGGMGFGEALEAAFDANFNVGGFFSDAFGDAFADLGDVIINDLWPSLSAAFSVMFDYLYNDVLAPFWTNTLGPWLSSLWNDYVYPFFASLGGKIIDAWLGSVAESWNEGKLGEAALIFLGPLAILFGPMAMALIGPLVTALGAFIAKALAATVAAPAAGAGLIAFIGSMAGAGAALIAGAAHLIGGAAVLTAVVAILGAGVGVALAAIGGGIWLFAEGMQKLGDIDGDNLIKVGAGLMAAAAGVGAMQLALAGGGMMAAVGGIGNAIGGIGNAIGGLFKGKSSEEETKKTGLAGMIEDLKVFANAEIKLENVDRNAEAVRIFASAMNNMTAFNASRARKSMEDSARVLDGNHFLEIKNQIKQFTEMTMDPERIKNVSESIVVFSDAMSRLSAVDAPKERTFWDRLRTTTPAVGEIEKLRLQIAAFAGMTIDGTDFKDKLESLKIFAEAMTSLANLKIPRIREPSRRWDHAAGKVINKTDIDNLQPHICSFMDLKIPPGLEKKVEDIKPFVEAMNSLASMNIPDVPDPRGWILKTGKAIDKSDLNNLQPHLSAFERLVIPANTKEQVEKIKPFIETMIELSKVNFDKLPEAELVQLGPTVGTMTTSVLAIWRHATAFSNMRLNSDKIAANAQAITHFSQAMQSVAGIDKLGDDLKVDSEKLEIIQQRIKMLVDNLNAVFTTTQAELTRLSVDDRFKTDLFGNKILSNMQGLITLKENIKSLSSSGPSPRAIRWMMEDLRDSIVQIGLKIGEIAWAANTVSVTMGTTALNDLKRVDELMQTLKSTADNLKAIQNITLKPEDIKTKMRHMKTGFENLKTGIDEMKTIIGEIKDSYGSHEDAKQAAGASFAPKEGHFDVAKALGPIDDIMIAVKGTMDGMKAIQDHGLDSGKVGTNIGKITTTLDTIKRSLQTFSTTMTEPETTKLQGDVTRIAGLFDVLNLQLLRLRNPAELLGSSLSLLAILGGSINTIGKLPTLNKNDITKKIDAMKVSISEFVDGVKGMIEGDDRITIEQDQKKFLEDLALATTNYEIAINSLGRLAGIRINVEQLQAKMNSYKDLVATVLATQGHMLGINDVITTLQGNSIDVGKTQAYLTSIDSIMLQVSSTMTAFTEHLPENVLAKAQQTIAAIGAMDSSFRSISGDPIVATAIAIGESFQGGGTVTFRHENININLAVNVQMSAEEIARGIIKTTVRGSSGKADEEIRIVTNPEKPDFSF